MDQTDIPVPAIPSKAEIHPRPADGLKTLGFWINQLFILLATVLGVYLASSQGFKQAMAYGEVQSGRSNYYLRQSLRNEIADNVAVLEKYVKNLGSGEPSARQAPMDFDMFVWECLKNSPNTLETPSELLREGRAFYRDAADVHQKIVNNTYAVGYGREQLQNQADRMRKEVLPAFDNDLQNLRNALRERGLELQ